MLRLAITVGVLQEYDLMTKSEPISTPIHQWTNSGEKVLLVKCVDKQGRSHNNFQWPSSGEVITPNWSPEPTCESGGLFGWPWGLNLGEGKSQDYSGTWIVFAAVPANVIDLGGKAKAGPSAEVLYYGDWQGALEFTRSGREAWLEHTFEAVRKKAAESKETSSTGECGAASSTGWSGAASSTGWSGAASSTGECGAASSTGSRGAASSTGECGAACITGNDSTLEVGPEAAGVCTAESFTWLVHLGAVVLHRWKGGHKLLTTDGLNEGDRLTVICGEIQK